MRKYLILAVIGAVFSTATYAQDVDIAISVPVDGSSVGQRPIFEGTVSETTAVVWIVVHPLEVSSYWVQPRVTVRDDGSWKVLIHIGRAGSVDVGKLFEVRAVVNPEIDLKEGDQLDSWPEAEATSGVVELIRR